MSSPSLVVRHLALAPLGAGDLVDRTIRLYRRHFATLLRMSVPPVVVSAAGAVLWALGMQGAFLTDYSGTLVAYILLAGVGALLQLVGTLLFAVVMGGATRNLVAHLLTGERVTVRGVYRNVRERFWSLLGATLIVGLWLFVVGMLASFVWLFAVGITAAVVGFLNLGVALPEWLLGTVLLLVMSASLIAALWVGFYLGGLVAYVLQAMMVEGRGVFESVNRSVVLARGHVRRLATVLFFTICASFSAWLLLITPLVYVGVAQGLSLSPWSGEDSPVWYSVGLQVLWQASSILLAPVWMLGLSLLYIDQRVRQEGYDVELAAARVLGDIPEMPANLDAPLAPALAPHAKADARTNHTASRSIISAP